MWPRPVLRADGSKELVGCLAIGPSLSVPRIVVDAGDARGVGACASSLILLQVLLLLSLLLLQLGLTCSLLLSHSDLMLRCDRVRFARWCMPSPSYDSTGIADAMHGRLSKARTALPWS